MIVNEEAVQKAVDALNALPAGDPESARGAADDIILGLLAKIECGAVVEAYNLCEKRCGGFWYA